MCLFGAFIYNFNAPLQGVHSIRQSDTVFAAYSYCLEGSDFLKPKVAHGGETGGVAIGEFPIYSYALSIPCQLRGAWSETDPKIFILILWVLNLLVWIRWSKKYFPNLTVTTSSRALLFGFSTFSLVFLTISLPDNLALLLVGVAALVEQTKWPLKHLISAVLFCLVFAVRPYLIPLAYLVSPRPRWLIGVLLGCIAIYLIWYKWWVLKSDLNYYYTAIPPVSEMILALPHYFLDLLHVILREWFHYLFLPLMIWKWKELKKPEVLGLLFSILLVVLVRGEHLVVHNYYLWAGYIFFFLCLIRVFASFKPLVQTFLILLYGLIGFAQSQHQFHRQAQTRYEQMQTLANNINLPKDAKVAVYVGEGSCSTHYLYWLKRHGWCFYEKEFIDEKHCPQGATHYLVFKGEEPILQPCIFVPTEKPNDR